MKMLLLCHLRKILHSLSQFGDTNIVPAALQWLQIFNRVSGKDPMHNRYGPPSEHQQRCFCRTHLLCAAQLGKLHNMAEPGLARPFLLFPQDVFGHECETTACKQMLLSNAGELAKIPSWRQRWAVSRFRGCISQKRQSTKVWPL